MQVCPVKMILIQGSLQDTVQAFILLSSSQVCTTLYFLSQYVSVKNPPHSAPEYISNKQSEDRECFILFLKNRPE